jgi:ABC-type nitrate/sulfonate/bicarbonate transport system permease component
MAYESVKVKKLLSLAFGLPLGLLMGCRRPCPWSLARCRSPWPACWVNLVGAELLAADQGLGYLISMGRRLALPDMVVLGMVSVGFVGAVIGYAIDRLERRLLSGIRR